MDTVDGLYSVVLYVRDFEASLVFYRDRLGLQQLNPADGGVVSLDAGGAHVVLHRADRVTWPSAAGALEPGGHVLTFRVDDPDRWATALAGQGVRIVAGPLDQVWGRVVFVNDPDGRPVALARPVRFRGPSSGPR